MSSAGGRPKVKIKIPKVRRNAREVRPYTELPSRDGKFDQILLWGTALILFAMVLAGGLLLWSWGRVPDSLNRPESAVLDESSIKPLQILGEARDQYIQGHMPEAEKKAHLALALEMASPSQPSLERDIRRLLGLVALQQKDYLAALDQLTWLKSHKPSADDLSNLAFCQEQVNRSMERAALDQLQGSQQLLVQGQEQRALAEARQAMRVLEAHQAEARSLQAGHLIVANIALQQGNARLALLELRAAQKAGSLGVRHLALLKDLERMEGHGKQVSTHPSAVVSPSMSMTRMQVQVVIPRLEAQASYPHGRPGSSRPRPPVRKKPTQPEPPEPGETALTPSGRPTPKLELPRLELPNSGSISGSLPSYQDQSGSSLPSYKDEGGSALPTYSNKTRPKDSLPGY